MVSERGSGIGPSPCLPPAPLTEPAYPGPPRGSRPAHHPTIPRPPCLRREDPEFQSRSDGWGRGWGWGGPCQASTPGSTAAGLASLVGLPDAPASCLEIVKVDICWALTGVGPALTVPNPKHTHHLCAGRDLVCLLPSGVPSTGPGRPDAPQITIEYEFASLESVQ